LHDNNSELRIPSLFELNFYPARCRCFNLQSFQVFSVFDVKISFARSLVPIFANNVVAPHSRARIISAASAIFISLVGA